jgi:hypothetical protein
MFIFSIRAALRAVAVSAPSLSSAATLFVQSEMQCSFWHFIGYVRAQNALIMELAINIDCA